MQQFIYQACAQTLSSVETNDQRHTALFVCGALSSVELPYAMDYPVGALFSAGFCGLGANLFGRLALWLFVPERLHSHFTAGVMGLTALRLMWRVFLLQKKKESVLLLRQQQQQQQQRTVVTDPTPTAFEGVPRHLE